MLPSLDLFSGIGGNAHAFRSFARPLLYCEVDARAASLLRVAGEAGCVPAAPVHPDVTTLLASDEYARVKALGPQLVTGSWPCQGNSVLGKRKGMDDARSGLLRTLCDVVLDARPALFFTENVPSAATNGSYDYMLEKMSGDYDVRCTFVRASDLGLLHERKRFFCLGVRRDVDLAALLAGLAFEPMADLLPQAQDEPARTVHVRPSRSDDVLHALGNAVVPAASYYAFLTMVDRAPALQAAATAARPDLVFDPAAYAAPGAPPARQTAAVLTAPWKCPRWSTPRAGNWGACHRLTTRSVRDLATQVRFERGTAERAWHVNPAWVAWLMGFPDGYFTVQK